MKKKSKTTNWLYQILCEKDVPVCCFASDRLDEMFNIPDPKVSHSEIENILWNGIKRGFIHVVHDGNIVIVKSEDLSNLLTVLPIPKRRSSHFVGLTKAGQNYWARKKGRGAKK